MPWQLLPWCAPCRTRETIIDRIVDTITVKIISTTTAVVKPAIVVVRFSQPLNVGSDEGGSSSDPVFILGRGGAQIFICLMGMNTNTKFSTMLYAVHLRIRATFRGQGGAIAAPPLKFVVWF